MGELIIFNARQVRSKKLQKSAVKEEKLKKYFFEEDYQKLQLLEQVLPLVTAKNKPLLFYPGCGGDIFTPLIYLQKLFPHLQKVRLLLLDLDNNFELLKTLLDEVGVSFTERKSFLDASLNYFFSWRKPKINQEISFYWQDLLVELEFRQGNVFSSLLEISKFDIIPQFDIYFERAFRIFKDNVPGYEQKIIGKLSSGGIIISDSGFEHLCFDSLNCLEKLPIPEQLSAYGEMVLGRKK